MIRQAIAAWLARRALRRASDRRAGRLRVVAEVELALWRGRRNGREER